MILTILLILINLWVLWTTREPQELVDVKEKYEILRTHLVNTKNPTFEVLEHRVPITGMKRMNGTVGFNTNKGAEITICLDGSVNEIFHVLIHELTHSTVDEYAHSPRFWKNYMELRDIAVELGIYEKITHKTAFCGEHVQDK